MKAIAPKPIIETGPGFTPDAQIANQIMSAVPPDGAADPDRTEELQSKDIDKLPPGLRSALLEAEQAIQNEAPIAPEDLGVSTYRIYGAKNDRLVIGYAVSGSGLSDGASDAFGRTIAFSTSGKKLDDQQFSDAG